MILDFENTLFRHLMASLVVIVVFWAIDKMLITLFHKKVKDVIRFYHIKKSIQYISVTLGTIVVFGIWISEIKSLSTFLGLFSAGIAIALKDLLVNIAAWFFILWRKPFEVGDRISVDGAAGDVIDQRLFQFTLNEINGYNDSDQSTGRIIHIPNSSIFNSHITNYGQGFAYIWNELGIVLTFESNWEKAKSKFLDFATQHCEHLNADAEKAIRASAKKFMIYYNNLTPIVYTSIKEHGIELTIRYLCEPRRKRSSSEKISEDVIRYVQREPDLDFAYPTQRIIMKE